MKQVVLITGGNGMLAKQLEKALDKDYTVRFLTRKKTRSNEYEWDLHSNYIDPKALIGVNSIIHLAGASIASNRWTKERKQLILSSRVDSAGLILRELQRQNITIDAFISASAIGYYGSITTDDVFDEQSPKGTDFLSDVCFEWESAAEAFKTSGVADRIGILRIGMILDQKDGALSKLIQPIKYGFGAGLGSGKQQMPWIHIQDLVRLIKFILDDPKIVGTFNAVSPYSITNIALTKKISQRLKKPLFLPNIPKFMLQILFGEMSTILLEGSKISSQKIIDSGFEFEFEQIDDTLDNLLKKG
jgi:uncharacterized protein (TIGR01777 family)